MKRLEPPDSHHLSAAHGWIGLGLWQDAGGELDKIGPEFQAHPDVLLVRYELAAHAQAWELAHEAACRLVQACPREPQYWIWQAYAKRRMSGGGIPQAKEILDHARQLFPKEPLIRYNLGCYECQLGDLQAAWNQLAAAFAVGDPRAVQAMALRDRDYEPLWPKIQTYKPNS